MGILRRPAVSGAGVRLWLWRVGRLAFARAHYPSIGGWRRLWWRLWWRVGSEPVLESAQVYRTEAGLLPGKPGHKTLHWVNGEGEPPICGASRREPWTIEYEFSTCAECKNEGEPLMIKHRMNTR